MDRAARCASTRAGSRWAERAGSIRRCSPTSATTRTSGPASPSGSASSASRCSVTASPTCASSGRTTCTCWSSSEMKVPVSWLREYVDFDLPVDELARRLVFTSCEVDRVVHRGVPDENGNLERFLVGKVLEADKHPNADRLQLTTVDVGEGEPRSIVCGAWNFGAGATVAVALPGATLPNGLTLERRKVRGEVSDGMILAEDEVGLGTDHSGIMVLPEAEPGTPLVDVLPLVDDVLLVESTGNRPDLLSIYGIAREVAALYRLPLADMAPTLSAGQAPNRQVEVELEDGEGCPRYIGRLF